MLYLNHTLYATVGQSLWDNTSIGWVVLDIGDSYSSLDALGSIDIPAPGTAPLDRWGRSQLLRLRITYNIPTNYGNLTIAELTTLSGNSVYLRGSYLSQVTGPNNFSSGDYLLHTFVKDSPYQIALVGNWVIFDKSNINPATCAGTYAVSLQSHVSYAFPTKGSDPQTHGLRFSYAGDLAYEYIWYADADPTPATPVLTYPANDASGVNTVDTVLTWDAAQYSDTYDLQVADNASFTNPIVNMNVGNALSYNLPTLLRKTKYYWRVRGKNSVAGSWATNNFTTPGYGFTAMQQMIL